MTERLILGRRLIQLILVFCVISSLNSDQMHLSQSQIAASEHIFQIESWVINNMLRLGYSQMKEFVRNDTLSDSERIAVVEEFFQLGESLRESQSGIEPQIARSVSESMISSSGV